MTQKRTNPGVGDVDFSLEVEQRLQQAISPEAREAFRELQADAPTGEGPIVRRAKRLLTPAAPRDAEESERKEHVGRADIHTHPLPEAEPAEKVVKKPRVENEAVTLPGAKKVEALAAMAVEGGGRSPAGTMRLAAMPKVPAGSEAADLVQPTAPAWPRVAIVLLIGAVLAGIVGIVVLFGGYVRDVEQRSSAATGMVARPVTATATATAAPAITPSEVASVASTVEPTALASATSEPRPTSRASAQKSGAPSARPSVSAAPSTPSPRPSASEWQPI